MLVVRDVGQWLLLLTFSLPLVRAIHLHQGIIAARSAAPLEPIVYFLCCLVVVAGVAVATQILLPCPAIHIDNVFALAGLRVAKLDDI